MSKRLLVAAFAAALSSAPLHAVRAEAVCPGLKLLIDAADERFKPVRDAGGVGRVTLGPLKACFAKGREAGWHYFCREEDHPGVGAPDQRNAAQRMAGTVLAEIESCLGADLREDKDMATPEGRLFNYVPDGAITVWVSSSPVASVTVDILDPPGHRKPGWMADPRTGCRMWNATPITGQTVSWSGGCVDELAQGRGTMQWIEEGAPRLQYEGDYAKGKRSGQGIMALLPGGERYEGTWRDDRQNGRGVQTAPGGIRYDGEWLDGERQGRGVLVFGDGNRYEGAFAEGLFQGRGVLVLGNGDRYEGAFVGGLPDGQGTYRSARGESFAGAWEKGCFHQDGRTTAVLVTRAQCGFK